MVKPLFFVLAATALLQDPGRPVRPAERAFERQEQAYFEICDYDGNGWVSMGEARESLELDQAAFGVFDDDSDGRITRMEFGERFRALIERHGNFKPPIARTIESLVPLRNAEQLRNAYDRNGDMGIDEFELAKLFSDYKRQSLPISVVLEKLDRNGTVKIDGDELELLARLLSLTYSSADQPEASIAGTIEELFGGLEERELGFESAPHPPIIRGPVRHFRRLDLDNDGYVSLEELKRLQAPAQLSVRVNTVLAAMDTDEDHRLSEAEFTNALQR